MSLFAKRYVDDEESPTELGTTLGFTFGVVNASVIAKDRNKVKIDEDDISFIFVLE